MSARQLFAVLGLLLAVPVAAADSGAEVAGTMEWAEAFGGGQMEARAAGPVIAVPFDRDAPVPSAGSFVVRGQDVTASLDYKDYVGTPAGLVSAENQPKHEEHPLGSTGLDLAQARADLALMIVPKGETSFPGLEASLATARLQGLERVDVRFWPETPGVEAPSEIQRTYRREAPAVLLETQELRGATRVTGDFTLYVWDADLREARPDGRTYASGVQRSAGPGQSDLAPNGIVHSARVQLLTVEVTAGEFVFELPQRLLHFFADPTQLQIQNQGFWDLTAATGSLAWGDATTTFDRAPVRMEGDILVEFEDADADRLHAEWSGRADRVNVGSETLSPMSSPVLVKKGSISLWWFVLGFAALGGGAFAVYQYRPRPAALNEAAVVESIEDDDYEALLKDSEAALESGLGGSEALMAKGIALLKLGRAEEVVRSFGQGFDETDPVAAVRAYLLSLAHLALGQTREGADWILRAIRLYPEFAHEVLANEAFAPVREDPRIHPHLQDKQEEHTGYV